MIVYVDEVCHVYTNTRYIYNVNNQTWGEVIDINRVDHLAKVKTRYGITDFGFHEIKSWVQERIISPVCGICNEPVHGGALNAHLQTHKVNVHG